MSSSILPDRPEADLPSDRHTKSSDKRINGRKSSEAKKEQSGSEPDQDKSDPARKLSDFTSRLSEAGRFGSPIHSEPSKKLSDLNVKHSEPVSKLTDVSRKHSDSSKSSESNKPSVHSTNLGRPEARSFAAVPERPAEFSSPKGALARRIDNLSKTVEAKSDESETAYSKPEQDRSIGWSNHILKPEPGDKSEPQIRLDSSSRSVWSESRVKQETPRTESSKPDTGSNNQYYQNKVSIQDTLIHFSYFMDWCFGFQSLYYI